MGELKVSGRQIYRGGQHVGTPPQVMRVEWVDGDQAIVAIEMFVGGQQSQFRAHQAAIVCIDLLLEELRQPARAALKETGNG